MEVTVEVVVDVVELTVVPDAGVILATLISKRVYFLALKTVFSTRKPKLVRLAMVLE